MTRAPRACNHIGCPHLVRGTARYCPIHKPEHQWQGSGGDRRSGTASHKQRRLRVLRRDGYQCHWRFEPICLGTADQLDHVRCSSPKVDRTPTPTVSAHASLPPTPQQHARAPRRGHRVNQDDPQRRLPMSTGDSVVTENDVSTREHLLSPTPRRRRSARHLGRVAPDLREIPRDRPDLGHRRAARSRSTGVPWGSADGGQRTAW